MQESEYLSRVLRLTALCRTQLLAREKDLDVLREDLTRLSGALESSSSHEREDLRREQVRWEQARVGTSSCAGKSYRGSRTAGNRTHHC